ncbi:phospholipid/cholesterol/gamma-HCH transport system substrate-binding protein [Breoghania corrubedonensis]|uniref:Phospholipid/cholesterol/gamma-HCH transport system substrate-binding protein n=1 Tax=Breoghania corrubedonensis TaxID=665038 RepID=A0A2T5V4P6_9HYPH|nr:MlaD family protein [Breoghania corrubedonensis]PTW58713.1 phospholipid/cholesterol/gamma-HCH transport system substrate-binding protein [Breoghania corrubedonensis]
METRANYIAIGSVVMLTIFSAFIFVWWLAGTGEGNSRRTLRVIFPGAVTGLEVGGQVFFNGIRVGEVTNLTFAEDDPTRVVAVTAIRPNTPLRADTKASLGFSGLTGVAYVELVGGSADKPSLLETEQNPELIAERSGFQDLMQGARDVLSKADQSLSTINGLIEDNRPAVGKAVDNITKFTDALAANSDGVGGFMASLSDATKAFTSLSGKLQGLVDRADTLITAVDPDKVSKFVDNMTNASGKLDNALDQVDQVAAGARKVTDELSQFSVGLNTVLEKVDAVVSAVDRDKIRMIVANVETVTNRLSAKAEEIDQIITDARAAAASIRETSDTVAAKSERISKFIDDAGSVADQLKTVAGNVNGVMDDAGKVIRSVDPNRVSDIVASVDKVTKSIAGQTTAIEGAIADARGASADLQAFTKDVRDRQPDIDRVISDARNVSGKLDVASSKVNDILTKVDGYVAGDGEGLIVEATAAARSIREVADKLNSRIGPITDGFARFSNRSLRNVDALIEQARQTLEEIRTVFANFDRNPSRVLYGGDDVPVYDGERKRR